MNLGNYGKAIAALVTGVIGWAAVVVASPPAAVTSSEWLGLCVVAATALGVYGVPNVPAWRNPRAESGQVTARLLLAILAGALGFLVLLGHGDAVKFLAGAVIALAVGLLVS